MLNSSQLQGRLTADPELRYTQSGTAITSFTLASDTGRKTKDGNRPTNFIDCVAWRNHAEIAGKCLTKGARDGPPRSRSTRSTSATARRTASRPDRLHRPATTPAPTASQRWRMAGISPSNATAGRPAADQIATKDTQPQNEGGDDRGMATSSPNTQGSPQAIRRC